MFFHARILKISTIRTAMLFVFLFVSLISSKAQATAIIEEPVANVSINTPNNFTVHEVKEFTVSTTVTSGEGYLVNGTAFFTSPEIPAGTVKSLEYFEVKDSNWYPLSFPIKFGPEGGFPLSNSTSKFRISFATPGTYNFSVEILKASDGTIISSKTGTFNVLADTTNPTITKLTAIVDGQEKISTDGKLSVAHNSTTSLIKLEASEPIAIEDSPGVNIEIDGINYPYGIVELDTTDTSNKTILVTPIGSNGLAALTGIFNFTFLGGSIIDLSGNENDPVNFELNVDGTKPDITSISTVIGGETTSYNKGETIQAEWNASVGLITATLTEDSKLVSSSSGDIYITGKLIDDETVITSHYGTFTVNKDHINITPDSGNDVLAKLGTFTFSVNTGVIEDLVGNKNDNFEINMVVSDTTPPTAEIHYSTTSMTQDNVVATLVNQSESIVITNNGGLNTYTFTDNGEFPFEIKDASGNTATITATVSNIDREAPALKNYYNSNYIISPANNDGKNDYSNIDIEFSERVSAKINILDEDGNLVKNIYSSSSVTDPREHRWDGTNTDGEVVLDGTYTIQIIGIDEALNQIIDLSKTIIVDNTAPIIIKAPENQKFEATGPTTSPSLISPTYTENYGSAITNYSPLSFPVGEEQLVTWTTTDSADNVTISNSYVTITDTTAPTISGIPSDMTIESPLSTSQKVEYPTPIATDLVDGNIDVICNPTSGSDFNMGINTVTCTTTDKAGNYDTKEFKIELKDTTPPVITIKEYNTKITNTDVLVEATVNEGSLEISSHTFTRYGEDFEFIAKDNALNISKKIVTLYNIDKVKPVITLNGDSNIEVPVGSNYEELGASVYDNLDKFLSVSIGGDTVNTDTLGNYTITYDATDTYGNKATQITRAINVTDREAPVITINGLSSINIYTRSIYNDDGATAKDNYDKDVIVTSEGSVNTRTAGTYNITYNAKDSSGNKATPVTRKIIVERAPSSGGGYYNPNSLVISPTPKIEPANNEGQVLGVEKFNFTLLLKIGSKGNEVIELQKFLNNLGYDCGLTDGHFGPKTKAAVIKFQVANGLTGDGIVGPLTRAALNK